MARKPKKSASKSAKKPTDYIKVGRKRLYKDTEMYRIVSVAASMKNQSVEKFVRENEKAVERIMEKGSSTIIKESDEVERIISAIPKRANVYINGNKETRTKAKFVVHSFKQNLLAVAEVYDRILHNIKFDLKGNLYLNIPYPEEYLDIDNEDDLLYFIDRKYKSIIYFVNKKKD